MSILIYSSEIVQHFSTATKLKLREREQKGTEINAHFLKYKLQKRLNTVKMLNLIFSILENVCINKAISNKQSIQN
jgi:hypothetical protein